MTLLVLAFPYGLLAYILFSLVHFRVTTCNPDPILVDGDFCASSDRFARDRLCSFRVADESVCDRDTRSRCVDR